MYGVELVRKVCKEKKVPIAKLERELGYANGYLNAKLKKIPYDRAVQIAKYLDIEVSQILGVEPTDVPAPAFELDAALDSEYGHDVTVHLHEYIQLDDRDRGVIDGSTRTLLNGEKYSAKEGSSAGAAT